MSWVLMVAVGGGLLFAMKYAPAWLDFILVRAAAGAFAGAGTIGAVGWLGTLMRTVLGWLIRLVDRIGIVMLGAAVAWIIVAGVGALWVGALLPDRLFKYDAPDWLIFSGLILPSLLIAVPGRAGDMLRAAVELAGHALINGVEWMF